MTSQLSTFQKSDRVFQVWEYLVSHGQLLIRSPKAPATGNSPELSTNIDLVCLGVEYMALPRRLSGLEIAPPTSDELRALDVVLGTAVDRKNVRILASEGKRFPVVAASCSFFENDWDIFESPLEFQSRHRAEP